jgi:hypothetical protein
MMQKLGASAIVSVISPRRIFDRNSTLGFVSKALNVMPFVGAATAASLLYVLQELHSTNLSSAVDQSLPWKMTGLGEFRWPSKDQPQRNVTSMFQQQQKVQFPSLNARLVQSNGPDQKSRHQSAFPINSDEPISIDNHLFQGTVSLVLRPLQSEHDPQFQQRLPLHIEQFKDEVPSFYFLLQGKFKRPIRKNALLVGGELLDPFIMDHTLSSWTRTWADLLLRLLSNNIGGNMSYSFGGRSGGSKDKDARVECPHIAFPVESAMMIADQDSSVSSCTIDVWDTETSYSLMFCASSIDLASWKVTYPFEMDIRRFWGDSPLRLVIYEKPEDGRKQNNYVFELQLDSIKKF